MASHLELVKSKRRSGNCSRELADRISRAKSLELGDGVRDGSARRSYGASSLLHDQEIVGHIVQVGGHQAGCLGFILLGESEEDTLVLFQCNIRHALERNRASNPFAHQIADEEQSIQKYSIVPRFGDSQMEIDIRPEEFLRLGQRLFHPIETLSDVLQFLTSGSFRS